MFTAQCMQGGLGDVGKFAVAHALQATNVALKPIAMTSRASAPAKFDFEVDVEPKKYREALKAVFDGLNPVQVCTLAVSTKYTSFFGMCRCNALRVQLSYIFSAN